MNFTNPELAALPTSANTSPPDMRLPIALALGWPERLPRTAYGLDWTSAATWEFEPLDEAAFPAVALCKAAGERGGTAPAAQRPGGQVGLQRCYGACWRRSYGPA